MLFAFSRCSIAVVYCLIISEIFNGIFSRTLIDFFWCRHEYVEKIRWNHLPSCNFWSAGFFFNQVYYVLYITFQSGLLCIIYIIYILYIYHNIHHIIYTYIYTLLLFLLFYFNLNKVKLIFNSTLLKEFFTVVHMYMQLINYMLVIIHFLIAFKGDEVRVVTSYSFLLKFISHHLSFVHYRSNRQWQQRYAHWNVKRRFT